MGGASHGEPKFRPSDDAPGAPRLPRPRANALRERSGVKTPLLRASHFLVLSHRTAPYAACARRSGVAAYRATVEWRGCLGASLLGRPFQTQRACEDHRRGRATIEATRGWVETRCVTHQEFMHHYPKSKSGDFGLDVVPEPDRPTRQHLRELGYLD
jgi:hypothetical protein